MTESRSFAIGQVRAFWLVLSLIFAGLSLIAFAPGGWDAAWVVYFCAHVTISVLLARMAMRDVRVGGGQVFVRNLVRTYRFSVPEIRDAGLAPASGTDRRKPPIPFLSLRSGRTVRLGALVPNVGADPEEVGRAVHALSRAVAAERRRGGQSQPVEQDER